MSWHFYLGYYRDMPGGRVTHNIPYIFLCIVSAIPCVIVTRSWIPACDGAVTPGANSYQLWVFFDLDTPSLVICEMPVKIIHLVQGDIINVFLDKAHGEKMPAYIQVHTPVIEPGIICNSDEGYS